MTSTTTAFDKARAEGRAALIGYFPAGYPSVDSSIRAMQVMVVAGCDVIEIGLPYSDPVMDGPTIQAAAQAALERGVRTKDVLRGHELGCSAVEGQVGGLADDRHGERDLEVGVACVHGYQGVAYDTDAVGAGQRDVRAQEPAFSHPFEPGHLPVPVQGGRTGEQGPRADIAPSRSDDRDAGPRGDVVVANHGGMPDSDAGDVADGVARTGLEDADTDSEVAESGHGATVAVAATAGFVQISQPTPSIGEVG